MTGFRRGVRLGIDVGQARVGVAKCDPDGLLATPVETVPRDEHAVARVAALAHEHSAFEILVGLPLNLKGEDTASTADARAFAAAVQPASELPVRLVDERDLWRRRAHDLRELGRNDVASDGIQGRVVFQPGDLHEAQRRDQPILREELEIERDQRRIDERTGDRRNFCRLGDERARGHVEIVPGTRARSVTGLLDSRSSEGST